jgi:bifunctional DNase/RNase
MHQYQVRGLALHEASRSPYLIIQNIYEGDTITMGVDPTEAGTLLMMLSGTASPVPRPEDVLSSFFDQHHFHPEYVSVQRLGGPLPRAVLRYRKGLRHFETSLQPAYGISLALRFEIPVYLSPEAIITGTINNPIHEYDREEAGEFLYIGRT